MSIAAPPDLLDPTQGAGAAGLLGVFNAAGVLDAADVHVAARLSELAGETDETVALALALVVRAVRGGSVCVDLGTVAAEVEVPDLRWPEPSAWLGAVQASVLADPPAVLRVYDDRLVYLDRYWREEEQVCADLLASVGVGDPVDENLLTGALDRVFRSAGYDEHRVAARIALSQWTTVLTGGPGTGKTTTVAALLALLSEQASLAGRLRPRIALAAPTGKAAARLQEAVQAEIDKLDTADSERLAGLHAVTLHRLLGTRPDTSVRFRHNRGNRLPDHGIV